MQPKNTICLWYDDDAEGAGDDLPVLAGDDAGAAESE
jgi:hypothetical protein